MRRSGQGSGGGLGSRPVTHTRAPKAEPRAHAINKDAVGQIGISQFLGRDPIREGRGYEPVGPTDNVAAVGVGGGRTVYQSGSQHGVRPAREMPAGKDILSDYGPDYKPRS
jgi:hypothetical protein